LFLDFSKINLEKKKLFLCFIFTKQATIDLQQLNKKTNQNFNKSNHTTYKTKSGLKKSMFEDLVTE